MNTSLTVIHYGSLPACPEISDSLCLTFTNSKLACRTNAIRTKQDKQFLTFLRFANTFGKFSFLMKTFSLKLLLTIPLGVARDVEFKLEMGYKDEIQACLTVVIVV